MVERDHPRMTSDEREEFLAGPHVAVLATEEASGRPHLTPVWYAWDGVAFTIATPPSAHRYRNLEARPRFTICVDKKSWPYRSLMAECAVVASERTRGYPEDLARRYLDGERLAAFLDRYRDLTWVVTRAKPTRWYGHINREG